MSKSSMFLYLVILCLHMGEAEQTARPRVWCSAAFLLFYWDWWMFVLIWLDFPSQVYSKARRWVYSKGCVAALNVWLGVDERFFLHSLGLNYDARILQRRSENFQIRLSNSKKRTKSCALFTISSCSYPRVSYMAGGWWSRCREQLPGYRHQLLVAISIFPRCFQGRITGVPQRVVGF